MKVGAFMIVWVDSSSRPALPAIACQSLAFLRQPGQGRQAGAAITKGRRSERDRRHSVPARGRVQGGAERLASYSEDALSLAAKLKITAVMAVVLMVVVWSVPV